MLRAMVFVAMSWHSVADPMVKVLRCIHEFGCVTESTQRDESDHKALDKCVEESPCLNGYRLQSMHTQWVQHYADHSHGMDAARQLIFKRSVVEAVVASIESPDVTFSYFSRFAETPTETLLTPLSSTPPFKGDGVLTTINVPTSHDWRDLGFTFPVQDQYMGQGVSTKGCGSCWAYATTGAMSGAYWMQSKKIVELSVQMLVDCDRDDETFPMRPNAGCGGGFTNTSYHDLERNQTLLVSANAYPYVGKDQACNVPSGQGLPWSQVVSHSFVAGAEDGMAAALVQYGPLAASLDAKALPRYKSGVLDPLFFQCNGANLNHALMIIGFGVDGSKPYWHIQNSWGSDWGEDGFFRLRKGKRACGIDQRPVYPTLIGSSHVLV